MVILSFLAMYLLMYSMVHSLADIHHNLNQVYMAGLMVAPMVVIEILVMSGMYRNKRLNAVIVAASCAAGIVCFVLIRQQTAISDRQFLRSMIPHHSAAILMCQEASLQDASIKELCKGIVAGQQSEIEQMRTLLGARSTER